MALLTSPFVIGSHWAYLAYKTKPVREHNVIMINIPGAFSSRALWRKSTKILLFVTSRVFLAMSPIGDIDIERVNMILIVDTL